MTTKTYTFSDLWSVSVSDNKTIANNTLAIRDSDTLSPEGGLSQYVTVLLHGNKIYTVESYRQETQVLLHILPDSFKWLTFLTTTRLNQICLAYGYKCHRDMTNRVYEVTTSPNRRGKIYSHLIYPDSYPILLTPYYHEDWIKPPQRGYIRD